MGESAYGAPLVQERRRSADKPMWLPVHDWIVAVEATDPETGVQATIPLREAQLVTPGFYMRRYDETGVWLEPLAVAGEDTGNG